MPHVFNTNVVTWSAMRLENQADRAHAVVAVRSQQQQHHHAMAWQALRASMIRAMHAVAAWQRARNMLIVAEGNSGCS
jgi:hypothetical protein